MKRFSFFWGCLAMIAFLSLSCEKESIDNPTADLSANAPVSNGAGDCTTIQRGELVDSQGVPIETGYDDWGYNYQAQMFNGLYCDADRNDNNPCDYEGATLIMKWNDAWLSNKDCDGDNLLDRHYGFDSYIGSGAWLTNHYWQTYEGENGETCEYDEFIKIVAAPTDAYIDNGFWYAADGTEIGEVIWGQFAIIQYVVNDPCAGIEGAQYVSPDHAGLGNL